MGSGLILLVIVGAWLAFFVQMALRSNESANVLGTVDKFHDAMRVLSRRQAAPRPRQGSRGRAPGPGFDPDPGTPSSVPTAHRTSAVASPVAGGGLLPSPSPSAGTSGTAAGADPASRRAQAAARRTRVLVGLAAAAVLTLLGAVTLSPWLLVPHLLVDLLLVGLVVHLRALAQGRAAAERRVAEALARERAATRAAAAAARSVEVRRPVPVVRRPVQIHVAGVPDRMPPRPKPLTAALSAALPGTQPAAVPAALPVPAARRAPAPDAPAVRGAQGEAWSPVPIPVPTYLSAPPAPRRVVDLTRAGAPPERRPSSEPEVGLHDVAPVEETVEHRRAVND